MSRYRAGSEGNLRVMRKATQAMLEAPAVGLWPKADEAQAESAPASLLDYQLETHDDIAIVEKEWRAFEQVADATAFQTFDFLATWYRHVGVRHNVTPAVSIVRDARREILLLLPFAISQRWSARELTWLGSDLCDYNAPLLAPHFSEVYPPARAAAMLRQILDRLRQHPRFGYDLVCLEKMPEVVGAQANPMLGLPTTVNPSGSYMTVLGPDWETFYQGKRSSATRRRDRTKRKRLAEMGDVRFVTAANADEVGRTLDTLMEQKAQAFAHMGVANLFARPGYSEFYRALATGPASGKLTHVSRLEVGPTMAATNFGLMFRDRYYYLLASYDAGEVSRFGPGAAHLHELMRHAIERGLRTFDFTIGDEAYKRDWCEARQTLHDYIAGGTPRGALLALAMRSTQGLKRRIKQTPALWKLVSAARELVGSLRRLVR
jgi:CelD/BcsL family acetyltransferase involved in cellulose biosynthesis